MFNMTLFAERLNEIIFDNKTSVIETAKAIGVPKSTIYRYLKEQRLPKLDILIRLSDYFKCSIDFLIGFENENYYSFKESYPVFSERFKFILNKFSTTKYKLRKDTDIPESIIYLWQNGKSQPSTENIIKLAEYFNCSIDYILGRSDIQ